MNRRFGTISMMCLAATLLLSCAPPPSAVLPKSASMTTAELQDRIKGGWAGQVIGCAFGGPTEFRYRGTFITDYTPIPWDEGRIKWWYENAPGIFDDVYMDLTFVEVFDRQGLDAPADQFALAFAHAEYPLWHANQAARYNILNGVMPPQSGHWLENPHADDIDFQIEADFAGLMCPGMVNSASEVCDRIGHIMNYGDGWYGGVYVAAMYALAFVSDDMDFVVTEALRTVPEQSTFRQCIEDVIRWHREYPDNWKECWFRAQEKWAEDVGCPEGVFTVFNIDAKINAAWIVTGLLYGEKDFGKTISISTRCGDDSDCNPANAAGILGAMIGYDAIPDYWRAPLEPVEDMDFQYTTMSLNDTYDMSFRQACGMIERNGGTVSDDQVTIIVQEPEPVPLEIGFEGHYPSERLSIDEVVADELIFTFEGIGFALTGEARATGDDDHVFETELYIDGELVRTADQPTVHLHRNQNPFWAYGLSEGTHTVRIRVLNPVRHARLTIGEAVVYRSLPVEPPY